MALLALLLTALAAWFLYRTFCLVTCFLKRRHEASRSGLPCFFSWLHVNDTSYILLHKVITSITAWIPQKQLRSWFPWSILVRVWHAGYEPFRYAQSDTFILTHPTGNMLVTCDPAICKQIFARSNDFKAPVETLYFYNIYGPTLAACDDEDWRRYRRVISPYFNVETNSAVLKESLCQTNDLLQLWPSGLGTITNIKKDIASRLTIGVIAKVFFGKNISLEDYTSQGKNKPKGERTFGEAILDCNNRLGVIVMFQFMAPWFKRLLPSSVTRIADQPYNEWKRHMVLLHDQVAEDLQYLDDTPKKFQTLLESMVAAEVSDKDVTGKSSNLTRNEVFGNIFILMLAGYDTASTTISFAILLLSLYPEYQKDLYEDMQRSLGEGTTFTDADLQSNMQNLLNGFLGAVIKETLRLYNAVEWLGKRAVLDTTLTDSDGVSHFVVKGTTCILDLAAMFRHPHYWPDPAQSGQNSKEVSPSLQFNPKRWIEGDPNTDPSVYFPFGGGQRMCPGRKFAEVLVGGVLSRLFCDYTIELIPDESDVNEAQRKGLGEEWVTARSRERATRSLYEGIGFNHSMFPAQHMPIQFIKRTDDVLVG